MNSYLGPKNNELKPLFAMNSENRSNKNSMDSSKDSKIMTPSFTNDLSVSEGSPQRYANTSNKPKRSLKFNLVN